MTTTRTRLAIAAMTAPLALALVACGDDDTASDDRAAVSSTPTTPTDHGTTPAPSDEGAATTGGGDLMTAAATGQGAVDGSTVFAVDRSDAGGWEVSVVTDDGTEYDVRVTDDGASVEGDPVEDTDTDDSAGEADRDTDERQRLLEVAVDHQAAVDASAGSGGTSLTGLELDEENGRATWEVAYDEDTPQEVTVTVDAESGEVVGTETDD